MLPLALMGMLGGAGSAIGGLAGLFGKKKNPNNAANQYLNQIPGAMQPYYKPYQDAGNAALGKVQGEYGKLIDNPGDMIKNFGSGYQESPGYQFQLQNALKAGQNSSAAGGMLGTGQDQAQAMQTAQGLSSQDYEKYLQHVMDMYGQGLQGEQGLETQGYGANTDYANMLGSLYGQQGQNAYNSTQNQNEENAKNWGNVAGGLAGMGTGYASGNYMDQYFKHMMGG